MPTVNTEKVIPKGAKTGDLEKGVSFLSAFGPELSQLSICLGGFLSSAVSKGRYFMLWTRKGEALGWTSEKARKEKGSPLKETHNGLTHKGNQVFPRPLKRLLHTTLVHQRGLRESWCWGSVGSHCFYLHEFHPFPKPPSRFLLLSPGLAVRMVPRGWP